MVHAVGRRDEVVARRGKEIAQRKRWSLVVGPCSRAVVRGLGHVVNGCDDYDRESCCDPTPSCTTTDRTPVTQVPLVHCVEV
ncbi:hypothetical protein ACSQ67_010642 [Phaseolus vulgaris]